MKDDSIMDLLAHCPTCGGDGKADYVPGASVRPDCDDCGGTGKVEVVRASTLRGAVSDDSERERRNALALDIESSIRREWPRLRTMHWPDATLMDAIQRALRDQRGAVDRYVADQTENGDPLVLDTATDPARVVCVCRFDQDAEMVASALNARGAV